MILPSRCMRCSFSLILSLCLTLNQILHVVTHIEKFVSKCLWMNIIILIRHNLVHADIYVLSLLKCWMILITNRRGIVLTHLSRHLIHSVTSLMTICLRKLLLRIHIVILVKEVGATYALVAAVSSVTTCPTPWMIAFCTCFVFVWLSSYPILLLILGSSNLDLFNFLFVCILISLVLAMILILMVVWWIIQDLLLLFLIVCILTVEVLEKAFFIFFELFLDGYCWNLSMSKEVSSVIKIDVQVFHITTILAVDSCHSTIDIRIIIKANDSSSNWGTIASLIGSGSRCELFIKMHVLTSLRRCNIKIFVRSESRSKIQSQIEWWILMSRWGSHLTCTVLIYNISAWWLTSSSWVLICISVYDWMGSCHRLYRVDILILRLEVLEIFKSILEELLLFLLMLILSLEVLWLISSWIETVVIVTCIISLVKKVMNPLSLAILSVVNNLASSVLDIVLSVLYLASCVLIVLLSFLWHCLIHIGNWKDTVDTAFALWNELLDVSFSFTSRHMSIAWLTCIEHTIIDAIKLSMMVSWDAHCTSKAVASTSSRLWSGII